VLELTQKAIETEAGLLFAGGAWLFSILPIYAALVQTGNLPGPEGGLLIAEGLLFTGTTGAGALLIAFSQLVAKLQED